MKLSAVIIARNEEEIIGDCISSLKFCDDLLVIDNGSTDNTADVAKKFGARVIKTEVRDFSELRNKGLQNIKSDWVLYVDADERVSDKLSDEISKVIKGSGNFSAYLLKRKNFYFESKEWPHIEKIARLFKFSHLRKWYGKLHESPKFDGVVGELDGYLLHYSHRNLKQMLDKTIEWSDIEANLRMSANHPQMSWWRFPRVMISSFLYSYISQKGYKVGTAGLVESIYQAFSTFITYARLWEKQNESKNE